MLNCVSQNELHLLAEMKFCDLGADTCSKDKMTFDLHSEDGCGGTEESSISSL
jgi:hypothetical protein